MTATPARRVMSAVALGAALLATQLACGMNELTRSAFVQQCENECATGVDRSVCTPYCNCAFDYVKDRPDLQRELEQGATSFTGGAGASAAMKGMLGACGSDLYDHEFRRSCTEACDPSGADTGCVTRCDCMLRELRGPGPRSESTVWLLDNMSSEPFTPAAQARMESAEQTCLSGT